MPIIFTFHPTSKDLICAAYTALRSRPLVFGMSIGFFAGIPWFMSLAWIIVSLFGAPISWLNALGLLSIPFFFFGFMALITVLQFRGAKTLQGPHTYEFTEGDIHLIGPGFDTRTQWGIVSSCYSGRFGLLFMTGKVPIISVPARTLSPDRKTHLHDLLLVKGITVSGSWKN